jgi:hypothetical protein
MFAYRRIINENVMKTLIIQLVPIRYASILALWHPENMTPIVFLLAVRFVIKTSLLLANVMVKLPVTFIPKASTQNI